MYQAILPLLAALGIPLRPNALANLPQTCSLKVTGVFLNGNTIEQVCTFTPDRQVGGLYTPLLTDVLAPSQKMVDCNMNAPAWSGVNEVKFEVTSGVNLPTGSAGATSFVIDNIRFVANLV